MTSSSSDFSISLVTGILPYYVPKSKDGQERQGRCRSRRTHVPKGSRPHLLWTSFDSGKTSSSFPSSSVGNLVNIRTGSKSPTSTSRGYYRIQQLLTLDTGTGLCLQQYGSVQKEETISPPPLSSPIPSRRPIAALCLGNKKESHTPSELVYVSDVVGNIYSAIARVVSSSETEPSFPTVRRRLERATGDTTETVSAVAAVMTCEWQWSLITPSNAFSPSTLLKDSGESGPSDSRAGKVGMYQGVPGWAGLSTLHYPGKQYLLSLREFYQDARVLDCEREGAVVHSYGLPHAPTGFYIPEALPYCFVAAEGTQCTVFDTRCPGVVMSWKEGIHLTVFKEETRNENSQGKFAGEAEEKGTQKGSKAKNPLPSLVQQQFTSISGLVRDVCGTSKPFEVAACIDRALCVFDLRRFNRLYTSSNVLKYNISSITPFAGGTGIVCTGIDSEVCVIPLPSDIRSADDQTKGVVAQKIPGGAGERDGGNGGDLLATAPGSSDPVCSNEELSGTFRSRLNRSVRCEETWQGGWVTSLCDYNNEASTSSCELVKGGACAIGISITGEVYLAQ